MKKRTLALILALILALSVAIPGTLAVSLDDDSSVATFSLDGEAEAPAEEADEGEEAPAEGEDPADEVPDEADEGDEAPVEEPAAEGEEPAEGEEVPEGDEPADEGEVSDDEPADEDVEADPEGEVSNDAEENGEEAEASLYDRLMACETAEEFDAILAACSEEELVFSDEEFDALDDYYVYLTTGEYPDHSPVVYEAMNIVNFTNVAPLVTSVSRESEATVQSLVSTYNSGIALLADAGDEPEDNSATSGLELSKSATANDDGTYTITLEAYATGSKVISSVNKDIPTDIVLVIDQSGSMDYCIVCGREFTSGQTHIADYRRVAAESVDTSKTYYILKDGQYTAVTYCNGTHSFNNGGKAPPGDGGNNKNDQCDGGAGWYTSTRKEDHTSNNKYDTSTTDFYEAVEEACSSRLAALETAVTTFVDSVNTKAKGADGEYGTEDDVNHRIAVVGFGTGNTDKATNSSPKYENTELFIGSNQYNYSDKDQSDDKSTLASAKYSSAFQDMNTETGYNNVIASKNAFTAAGATQVDLGIEMANGIFKANPINANEKRNRVMIVFTDGSPSSWLGYDSSVASGAIANASTTKNTYNATVYTVGIFDGADATSAGSNSNDATDTQKSNWFLQNVSSNNGTVQNPSYYLSAGDSTALNNIFQQIADQIESGGSSTTLDASTVIKDIITPQFTLPEGANKDSITLETYACTGVGQDGEYTWSKNDTAMGATAIITSTGEDTGDATTQNNQVEVTGFDFSENWVGTTTTDGNTTYRGNKLVISFTVKPRDGFLGGNDVNTNTSAGVYENATEKEPVAEFGKPQVNVSTDDLNLTAVDTNVYLGASAGTTVSGSEILENTTFTVDGIELDLTKDNLGLDSWKTEYVDIDVTITNSNNQEVTEFKDIVDDASYTVTVTISPKTPNPTSKEGEVAKSHTASGSGTIHVFVPELTYKDSEVWYGGAVATDFSDNLQSKKWVHTDDNVTKYSTDKDVTMVGTAPELNISYVVDSSKVANGLVNTKEDIAVDVTVKIGDWPVNDYVTFVHTDCTGKSCGKPDNGKFWLHVNTCSLTITKAAGANTTIGEDEYFVFNVKKDDADYTQVVIQGTGSETLSGLPVGSYTVVEDASTAWRYTSSGSDGVTLSSTTNSGTITVTNTKTNDKWLNHFAQVINTYGKTN